MKYVAWHRRPENDNVGKKIKESVGLLVKLGGWAGQNEQTTVGLLQILSLNWELRKGFSLQH